MKQTITQHEQPMKFAYAIWAVIQTYSKRSQKKENYLAALTLRNFLLQPGRSLCSQNPCWGLTSSQLHHVIITVHHNYAAPWPWCSEKSAWSNHCEWVIHAQEGTLEDRWRAYFQQLVSFSLSPCTSQERFISSCDKSLLLEPTESLDWDSARCPTLSWCLRKFDFVFTAPRGERDV